MLIVILIGLLVKVVVGDFFFFFLATEKGRIFFAKQNHVSLNDT